MSVKTTCFKSCTYHMGGSVTIPNSLLVNSFRFFHVSLLLCVINLTCHPLLSVTVNVPDSSAPGSAATITYTAIKSTPNAMCQLLILMQFLFICCYSNLH